MTVYLQNSKSSIQLWESDENKMGKKFNDTNYIFKNRSSVSNSSLHGENNTYISISMHEFNECF